MRIIESLKTIKRLIHTITMATIILAYFYFLNKVINKVKITPHGKFCILISDINMFSYIPKKYDLCTF